MCFYKYISIHILKSVKLHHLKSCPLILSSLHSAVFGILEVKKKKKDLLPDFINHGILSKTRLFEFQSVVEELVEKIIVTIEISPSQLNVIFHKTVQPSL